MGGKSLIEFTVSGALQSQHVTRTVFTSDDDEMMQEAKRCGAEVLFRRPDDLASDTASSWSVVEHAVNWLEKNENWVPDFIVLLQPTTPLRNAKHIDEGIDKMLLEGKSSCISVREVDYPPQWMFYIDTTGEPKKLFQETQTITRRQDAPLVWQPNGLIYIVKREKLKQDLKLPQKDTCFYKMGFEDSVNIDNLWQYELAKIFFKRIKKED